MLSYLALIVNKLEMEMGLIFSIIILLFSITIHECMHAWTASYLGDQTARRFGRVTLNPIPHIDIIGTILLPLLLIVTGSPFIIGWAKPVPINPNNFANPRVGTNRRLSLSQKELPKDCEHISENSIYALMGAFSL